MNLLGASRGISPKATHGCKYNCLYSPCPSWFLIQFAITSSLVYFPTLDTKYPSLQNSPPHSRFFTMVPVRPDLKKSYPVPHQLDTLAYLPQAYIHIFINRNATIFRRAYILVDKVRYIETSMHIFTVRHLLCRPPQPDYISLRASPQQAAGYSSSHRYRQRAVSSVVNKKNDSTHSQAEHCCFT